MAVRLSSSLICVCLAIVMVRCASGNTDVDALTALRNSLSDPNHALDSWDPNLVDACTWFHVTCNDAKRVIRLDLGMLNLGGQLVAELGNLQFLQYMEMYGNHIQGSIPSAIGNLSNLLSLDLYNNALSGSIPAELSKLHSILFMRLNDNKLTGTVPQGIASLPKLAVLDLTNNNLSGYVPKKP